MNIVGPTGGTRPPDLGNGALTVMEEVEPYIDWIISPDEDEQKVILPTSDNLLDKEIREKLPLLFSGEEQGLDATTHVKFFTLVPQWAWHASEFFGGDIFCALVLGFEV